MAGPISKGIPKVFFPNLDGLRFIAFFIVFIEHLLATFNYKVPESSSSFTKALLNIDRGELGVSIFFVLSGFLITYLLLIEKSQTGIINVKYFYIRRVLRIWPIYIVVVIFLLFIYPFIKSLIGIESHLAYNPFYFFAFLSNFDIIRVIKHFPGQDYMAAQVTWSVSVEEQFYLIWPLLFYCLPQKLYKYIFLSVIFLCLLFRIVNHEDYVLQYFHSLGVCADLAIGGLSAYLIFNHQRVLTFFKTLRKSTIISLYFLGFTWILIRSEVSAPYFSVFSRLVSTLFFCFVILEQNFCNNSFYKFSKSKFLSFWGKYTYGLYLFHCIVLLFFDILLRKFNIGNKSIEFIILIGIISLTVSLLISYLSFEYFESRFLKLKSRFNVVQNSNNKVLKASVVSSEYSTAPEV